MHLDDLDYPLPKELIAQRPLAQRDSSRLLVVDRASGSLKDRQFSDILDLIPSGDTLVLNDTKVFPARLMGQKKLTGGKVDLLLLERQAERLWRCLIQPALKEGQEISFSGQEVTAQFVGRTADGICLVEFKDVADVRAFASQVGHMPLPPYVKREDDVLDKDSYQTVFAKNEGAVAAPTAGLHFSEMLLDRLRQNGVKVLFVTLHVGYGTFKPIDNLENHKIHTENFELKPEVADAINETKVAGGKLWAVGTTSFRVLETCVKSGKLISGTGQTDLFVKPPFECEIVDHLITNFHLPKTTLLLLVSAFMGEDLRKRAYAHAVEQRYRFFSYGDAMVVI